MKVRMVIEFDETTRIVIAASNDQHEPGKIRKRLATRAECIGFVNSAMELHEAGMAEELDMRKLDYPEEFTHGGKWVPDQRF